MLKVGASTELVGFVADDWTIVAISFFDDLELAVLIQSNTGERYLGTVEYTSAAYAPVESITGQADLIAALGRQVSPSPMPSSHLPLDNDLTQLRSS